MVAPVKSRFDKVTNDQKKRSLFLEVCEVVMYGLASILAEQLFRFRLSS